MEKIVIAKIGKNTEEAHKTDLTTTTKEYESH